MGHRPERLLIGAVLLLVCIGLVEVYSVSSARAVIEGDSPTSLIKRQVIYALVGFVALGLVARIRMERLRRIAPAAIFVSIAMLVAVLVLPLGGGPVHGVLANGAKRWLAIGPIQLQPSEIAKMALVLWIATAVTRDPRRLAQPRGLMPYAVLTGLLAALIELEPDMGTTGLLVATAFAMAFVAGAPPRKLATIAGSAAGLVMLIVIVSPYQRARVSSFLNPWADATGSGFQSVQGQIAIGSGGIFGVGPGNSIQKNFFLPEAHTDMIAAIIGEELGLIGLGTVILAFVAIGVAGFRIAMRARDMHQRLIATGITSLICLQAGVNLAQVFGVMPVTGVPLPFVSAGGTSLVVFLAGVGVLVNIARRGSAPAARTAGNRPAAGGDRSGRHGRPRQAGAGDRRRLAS